MAAISQSLAKHVDRFVKPLQALYPDFKELSDPLRTRMAIALDIARRIFTQDLPQFFPIKDWAILSLSSEPLAKQPLEEKIYSTFLIACCLTARSADRKLQPKQIELFLGQFAASKDPSFDKASLKPLFDSMKTDSFWQANPLLSELTTDLYGAPKDSHCILC